MVLYFGEGVRVRFNIVTLLMGSSLLYPIFSTPTWTVCEAMKATSLYTCAWFLFWINAFYLLGYLVDLLFEWFIVRSLTKTSIAEQTPLLHV